ncbi:hypothetical protein [Nannocystis punicea]|uniref:Uncharacterized protein n=1 Tax=Nannocystis punicea TaxID=2995304 RepID=A0ABY7GSH5_9BACT|nr:hypothetical protein [Nannocystis poenicansa]WAS89884.1 hypothetical protein O0S08_27135 [Nannocystis poenicansa]
MKSTLRRSPLFRRALRHWDSCLSGYYSIGTVFHSNGFWLCAPNGASRRHWVGNVVNGDGSYYLVTCYYAPTFEGHDLSGMTGRPAGGAGRLDAVGGRSARRAGFTA